MNSFAPSGFLWLTSCQPLQCAPGGRKAHVPVGRCESLSIVSLLIHAWTHRPWSGCAPPPWSRYCRGARGPSRDHWSISSRGPHGQLLVWKSGVLQLQVCAPWGRGDTTCANRNGNLATVTHVTDDLVTSCTRSRYVADTTDRICDRCTTMLTRMVPEKVYTTATGHCEG